MRIAILSKGINLYSTSRLVAAATSRNHKVSVYDYLRCCIKLSSPNSRILYKGENLEKFDAVIPRIAQKYTYYGNAVVKQFELCGSLVLNNDRAIALSRDKLRCYQVLAAAGIGLPVTTFGHDSKEKSEMVSAVDSHSLILKLLQGTHGCGVMLAENKKTARATIEAFNGVKVPILCQEFIEGGADIRALVVGNQVIASMERRSSTDEFRSNLHRGGSAVAIDLTSSEKQMCILATIAVGLSVAGVDFMRSSKGAVVIEINSSPGLEGIETHTGVDVAGAIITFLEQKLGNLQLAVAI